MVIFETVDDMHREPLLKLYHCLSAQGSSLYPIRHRCMTTLEPKFMELASNKKCHFSH